MRFSAVVLSACTAITGCTSFSTDSGFSAVRDETKARLGREVEWPRSADERRKTELEVAALLTHQLDVDDAVQIALLNNHALQASFQELGISEADLVQAGRLPNPRFTLLHTAGGGVTDTEAALTLNVLSLLTLPYQRETARRQFARTQSAVILDILTLADRTRTAYYTALAARETLRYARQVRDAAQTGAELARRMQAAGNWNRLDDARQQSFYLEALQQLARAEEHDAAARAELERLLGLEDGAGPVQIAERLPELPRILHETPDLAHDALQNRIDLQLRRADVETLARRLQLTRTTRFIDVLDVGPARVRNGSDGTPMEKGYEFSLQIPIFDSGAARTRRAEAVYRQSVAELTQAAVDARAQIIEALAAYRSAYDLAVRERDDILPLRQQIAAEDLLRYNASLISIFDLLADARDRITGINDYIERSRDFWIAKSHLDTALLGGVSPPSGVTP